MVNRFIITKQHADRQVFLCWGGGLRSWWTPHVSMASKLLEPEAIRLWERNGGQLVRSDKSV